MKKQYSRFLSVLLIITMLLTLLPVQVLAEEIDNIVPEPQFPIEQAKPEGKIIGEAIEKREKNIKHFRKDDGTYEAVIYPSAVHYSDNGTWKDIDNTVIDSKDEEGEDILENKNNDYKVKIAKSSLNKKLVRITKENYELSWGIYNGQSTASVEAPINPEESFSLSENDKIKTLTKLSSTINFNNVYPDIDLQYQILPEQLKENIILNKYTDNTEFVFKLYTKGLTATLLDDNTVVFYDESDEAKEVFKFQAPYMFDANGDESRDIRLILDSTKDGYILAMMPNQEWLNSPDRKYPVVIDPVVETSLNINQIYDNHVSSANPNTNYYVDYYLKVGYGSTIGSTRTYIKFTLPTLKSADLVTSVRLSLIPYLTHGVQVNVHKVNSQWSSNTITWNNQPAFDPNASKVEDYFVTTDTTDNKWDITSIAKDWYNTGVNYGLMLKAENETSGSGTPEHFYSSDIGISSYRPVAYISYINNSGLENYWTYHSQSAGRAGTGYINDYNGNLVFTHNDLSMNGNLMPVTINHVYNSNDKDTDIRYGYGWRLNISQRVVSQTISGTQYYVHTDEDGTKHYYKYDSAKGLYVDEAGSNFTLKVNADGTYSIKDKDGNELLFTSPGYLQYIKDRNGNYIEL